MTEGELIDLIEKLVKENLSNGNAQNLGMMDTPTAKYKDLLEKEDIEEDDGEEGCAESEGGSGCIKKRGSGWVILNNKEGGVWKKCKSKAHCEEILDGYHASKG